MGVVKTEYGLCYTADTCFNQYSDFEDCGLYVGDTGKIFISQAKKIKNVYHLIYECSNLIRAQYKAQQGKGEVPKYPSSMRTFWRIWIACTGTCAMKLIPPVNIGLRLYMSRKKG